ncbi:hypothetical protein [Myceligenerans salitolerans]|uniref:Uncharacterized protein n=1 Tax=Myceligenerans salitolerans TaxID=1230528 RepID=A0ABS3ICC9_9MICO|nr:hypothetical protein [Myceligenerans salitolerans]MBO0610687.1 hypothetical protein [Myceligenerans salitolerans]
MMVQLGGIVAAEKTDLSQFAVVLVEGEDWSFIGPRLTAGYDPVSRINVPRGRFPNSRARRICLLVHDQKIVGLCLGAYRSASADVDHMIGLERLRRFAPALAVSRFLSQVSSQLRADMAETLGAGQLLAKAETVEAEAVIDGDMLYGQVLAELKALLARQSETDSRSVLLRAEQRDAMAAALEAVGLDSKATLPIVEYDELDDGHLPPFIDQLEALPMTEAAAIRHDFARMPGWLQHSDGLAHRDTVTFADPGSRRDKVTVTYADKERLERITGTDLIYFRTHQPGYVMVQYKRMVAETPGGKQLYRPDDQLREEIRRMRKFASARNDRMASPADYRLSAGPFYMKVIDAQVRRRDDARLVDGMYFPLELFERMLASGDHVGPRSGTIITRGNAPKHLGNDLFITLLRGGWIDSVGHGTDQLGGQLAGELQDLVEDRLGHQRGVLIAEDHRHPSDGWGRGRSSASNGQWQTFDQPD